MRIFPILPWRRALSAAVLGAGLLLCLFPAQSQMRDAADRPLHVLVVNSFHPDIPWQRSFEKGLRDRIGKSKRPARIYTEYMDMGRLPAAGSLDWFQRYLEAKYRETGIDVLMSESGPATNFVNLRPGLFPDAKRIYLQPAFQRIETGPQSIVINAADDYEAAIAEMRRLVKPRRLYVIADASTPARQRRLATFKAALEKTAPALETTFLVDLPIDRLRERVASLPPDSAIFYLLIFQDGAGRQFVPYEAARIIAERANAPVFSNWESLLGSGIIGGHLISGELLGEIAAETALGESASQTGPMAYGYYYDARQLRRWNIDASRLPADAAIRFERPSLFARYRWQILATIAALLLLSIVSATMATLNVSLRQARREALENEREYRNILDRLQDVFYRTDTEGRIVMVSPSVENVLGYRPEEVIGERLAEHYVNPDQREQFVARLAEGGGEIFAFEAPLRHKDGRAVTLSTNAHYKFDDEGRIVGVEGVARDVSERKALEDRLRKAQKMEAIGQLTGGIAHDFNNLLAVVSGNSELLAGRIGDNKNLAAIRRAARRGADLTQRLLAFSRQQALKPEPIDLNDLIAGLVELLRATLEESIAVETRSAGNMWPVQADSSQLENALLNLALNARDAMGRGGTLTIRCENIHLEEQTAQFGEPLRAGDYVRISMADTGIGMSDQEISRAIEPFYTTKDVGQGSGLGLPMVYGFARQSGGDISIESAPGAGATVSIYLPRTDIAMREAKRRAEAELKRGDGQRILVLEDEPDVRNITVQTLRFLGYDVTEAGDAREALDKLDAMGGADLVLSDIVLPGHFSGPQFVAEARSRYPGIRAVFMTGYAPENTELNDLLNQGQAVLLKPFPIVDLAKTLHDSLNGAPAGA